MFNRTLRRPMFRRGGKAEGGITSGLKRQGYVHGGDIDDHTNASGSYFKPDNTISNNNMSDMTKVTSQRDLINELSPRYNNQGSDFFMGLGANILAAPGGNSIFETLGTAAKEPLNLMMKQNMAQSSSDRELIANLVKGLDDETLSAIQKDARAAVASGMFDGDYNKAIKALLNKKIYGTQNTEAEYEQERIDFLEANILKTDMTGSLSSVARSIATHMHKIQSGQYDGTVDQNGDSIEFSKVKTFFKDGDIGRVGEKEDGTMLYELTENGLGKWNAYEGLAVFDYRTGKLFKKQGNNFVEVIIGEKQTEE
jgi:hypothetical protein